MEGLIFNAVLRLDGHVRIPGQLRHLFQFKVDSDSSPTAAGGQNAK